MKVDRFCEFELIKAYFKPLTPYGKDFKENIDIITDKDLLTRRYDAIDLLRDFKKKKRTAYDKIKYHLKNITYLTPTKTPRDIADIFIIKKFINNYYAIYSNLPLRLKEFFGFGWELDGLYSFLNPDGVSDNFYISDSYSDKLKKKREELALVVDEIARIKEEFRKEVLERFDIKLEGDFVVVLSDRFKGVEELERYFVVDIYDSQRFLLRPKYNSSYLNALKKREEILSHIKEMEIEIVKQIISLIEKDFQKILSYIKPIYELDIAVASCDMADELGLRRPVLRMRGGIIIKNGVFLPLKKLLDEMKVPYTPLDFSFNKRINIIQGSNMGGKTVVLKTIALLQYMAQCGFFVPADEFKTLLFERIAVPIADEEIKGLSSFAYEIYTMSKEIENVKDGKLILIIADEFAKTTNYTEGVAIINALMDYFSSQPNIYFFLATHFSGIRRDQNTSFLRMKGFNRHNYMRFNTGEKKDIKEKIKLINRFMEYKIMKVSESDLILSDAIEIAQIIGMKSEICEDAKKYLEGGYEKEKKK